MAYGILGRAPSFTIATVVSLALGINTNAAVFQLVDAIRLKMLPVLSPDEPVSIDFEPNSMRAGWFSTRSARLTYAQWDQIRHQQRAFTGVIAWSSTRFHLAPSGERRYAEGLYMSGDFFRVLGVNALIGRTFTEQEDNDACVNARAVISHAFWAARV
jgi:hypothetical protein